MILGVLAMFQATVMPTPHVILPLLPAAPRLGVAAEPCRAWTRNKRRSPAKRKADREWLLGFIEGIGFTTNALSTPRILRSTDDPEAMIVFVDTHCAAMPESTVGEAAAALWLSLAERR